MHQQNTRALVAYLIGLGLLSVYGGQVCPFLDTLSIPGLLLVLGPIFIFGWAARHLMVRLQFAAA